MLSSREAFENDHCPVRDDLLGAMYRANENGLPALVDSVSSDVRAQLALFCYRRAHLHALAVTIAASCEVRDLIHHGGRVGSVLAALAREEAKPRHRPQASYSHRKAITLSTTPLSSFAPLDEDGLDDDLPPHVEAEAEPSLAGLG
ncbi:hypothetical protein LPW26_24530 [Rhodopseudomonas sp. HC1]|uniref:hypothetical protein n=1 Tax=Rhodopseudomonas infernalis TaxID=2897386 RepID=UPI001EE9110B|nr:hypothetical protein [Rhodopseudomonas infernalis]MCG6207828.1 hypothetical protein [Rhodopseudomonas infernalis]